MEVPSEMAPPPSQAADPRANEVGLDSEAPGWEGGQRLQQ